VDQKGRKRYQVVPPKKKKGEKCSAVKMIEKSFIKSKRQEIDKQQEGAKGGRFTDSSEWAGKRICGEKGVKTVERDSSLTNKKEYYTK